jgi:hypothetical protein
MSDYIRVGESYIIKAEKYDENVPLNKKLVSSKQLFYTLLVISVGVFVCFLLILSKL